jgi:hypothetical protein
MCIFYHAIDMHLTHKADYTKCPARSKAFLYHLMLPFGRLLLYAVTGVVGSVSASKRLLTRLDFQRNEGLEAAEGV